MDADSASSELSRRDLLRMIGVTAGAVYLSDARVADVVNCVRNNFGNRYKSQITPKQVAALPHPGTASPP